MIDGLELTADHAELVIEKAIEFGAYSDDMPETDKEKIEAAHEQIAFMIDARTDEGVTADHEDEDIATAGRQMDEIFEIAGISFDKKNNVVFGELPEIETEGDDDSSDDEFDINDIIPKYDSKSVAKIVAALEDLDADDVAKVKAYEKNEGKGRDQILDFEPEESEEESEAGEELTRADLNSYDRDALKALIKENDLGKLAELGIMKSTTDDEIRDIIQKVAELADGGDEEEPEPEDDDAEPEESEEESEAGEVEEPWEDWNTDSIKSIKEALEAAVSSDDEDEQPDADAIANAIAWEEANKKRKSLLTFLRELHATLSGEGDEEDDDAEPDEEPEDEAPAKSKAKAKGVKAKDEPAGTTIVITREQLLMALTDGEVEIALA